MGFFSPAEVLTLHGLVLMICGALAYQESGFAKSAMSAMYVGNGGAVVSILLATGVRNTKLKKGEPGYKMMMICVHLAVVYPIILGAAVAWRLWLAWNVPEKAYLKPFFSAIVGMCAFTAAFMLASKPKKEKAPEKKDDGASVATETATMTNLQSGASGSVTKRKPRKASAM